MTRVAHTARTWQLSLTPRPDSVAEARRQVRLTLCRWSVPADVVDTAVLITSELVTNALRFCSDQQPVQVNVTEAGDEVQLEVSDPSRTHPSLRAAAPDDENGRGLLIVRAAATRFGVRDRAPNGKTVWASLEVGDPTC